MKKNTLLIFSLLLFYLYPAFASVEVRSNKLTTGDGLANNSIRYMSQDSKGFIWLGTLNGLSYYDGNSFVNIYPDIHNPLSLADSRIRSIEEDPNGFLWISTMSSFISCYDLRHGRLWISPDATNIKKTILNSSLPPIIPSGYGIIKTDAEESFIRMGSSRHRLIRKSWEIYLPTGCSLYWKAPKEKSGSEPVKGY